MSAYNDCVGQSTEKLNRGLIAIPKENDAYLSWRLLESDPATVAFDVFRQYPSEKIKKLTKKPITESTQFTDTTVDRSKNPLYSIRLTNTEKALATATLLDTTYIRIPLQTPEGYEPNDASVGDLDGDGEYEIILHQKGRSKDNSQSGFTDEPILEAYEMDGTLLWRINLGKNIREGAHYTQFIVYDLDGDGKAEIACKTADGTIDGKGKIIGDAAADWRNEAGYILSGPEYLTVFDGETGEALATTNYNPPRHPDTLTPTTNQLKTLWGDGYGNRLDRFLAGVAYLDGKTPSLIMSRGYYTRIVIAAWDFKDNMLSKRWTFDTDQPENKNYRGEGNHSLSIADVDHDGKDEIIFGAAVIDDDGSGLYATGMGHGDALHVSDLDPELEGLEVFDIQERFDDAGAHFRNAETGEILWKKPSIKAGSDGEGPGRGNAFDIDPRYWGAECWVAGAGIQGLFNAKGEKIADKQPRSVNFGIWWDGDKLRELLDRNKIYKWNWETEALETLFVATETTSNNGTKSTPALSADILGDWREEVILREVNNKALRIYSTTIPTSYRFTTLMQNRQYRLSIAWQNVGYNQPPHLSYFLGADKPDESN